MSILSIWAELLAWRSQSARSAFHQRVCPWVLKYGYLYGSLELAEFPISCDGCALAGAVYFSPTLPFFPSVSLEWKRVLFPFHVGYFFSDFSSSSPALEKGGKSQKGCHWLCIFVRLTEERCLRLCCYSL